MAKRPKQSDVAKLAGVSRATVSYVLNQRQDGKIPISDITREKVLKAAETLGYEPNDLARSLRTGESKSIGVLIPSVNNPHYWEILEGAEEVITQNGYHLALVISNLDAKRERECLRSLFKQRLDGVILMPTYSDMYQDELYTLKAMKIPTIFTNPTEGMDWVFPNITQGAELIMNHIISLGHTRIALINGTARKRLTQSRKEVYQQKLLSNNLPIIDEYIRDCGPQLEDGYIETQKLLSLPNPPTAIWAINDLLALGVLSAIQERNLRVPDDIAVAGFDDIPFARYYSPPLTTVRMPSKIVGRRAAEFLFQRLQNPRLEPMRQVLDTELIIRKSTVREASSNQFSPGYSSETNN